MSEVSETEASAPADRIERPLCAMVAAPRPGCKKAIDIDTGQGSIHALLAIAYSEQGDEQRARAAAAEVRRKFPDLKPPTLPARECVAEDWCQFLQTKYLPAWRKAGLP